MFKFLNLKFLALVLGLAGGLFAVNGVDPALVAKYKQEMGNEKILNLELRQLNDEDARAIAELLKTNQTLQTLSLRKNRGITDIGLKALAEAMKTNKTLRELNIRGLNQISIDGQKALTDALKYNMSLHSVLNDFELYESLEQEPPQAEKDNEELMRKELEFNQKLHQLIEDNKEKLKAYPNLKSLPKELITKIFENILHATWAEITKR